MIWLKFIGVLMLGISVFGEVYDVVVCILVVKIGDRFVGLEMVFNDVGVVFIKGISVWFESVIE